MASWIWVVLRPGVHHARTGRAVTIGAVYATLERLTDKALVRSIARERRPDRDGRARFFFEVTNDGRAALLDAERMRAQLRPVRAHS